MASTYATLSIVSSSGLIAVIPDATATAALASDTIAASCQATPSVAAIARAYYYTGANGTTPNGNSVWFESSYDVGRFGMLGACPKAFAGGILEGVWSYFCAVVGALQVVDASQREFMPTDFNNVVGLLKRLASTTAVVFQATGATDTPSHAPSP
jgi:hypothetical protein